MGISRSTVKIDIGRAVLRFRFVIGLVLIAVSAFMALGASKVQVATRFVDFFPRAHRNVELYDSFSKRFGGAQSIAFMVATKYGDIFNYSTLNIIRVISRAADKLPGVNHQSIRSLASFRVTYSTVVQGGIQSKPYMFPSVPHSEAGIEDLKRAVLTHQLDLKSIISPDN